ncbi:uncharacterized protein METZ01_LOCUS64549 [marine metagenome]|uniref:Uncharacterized protein n=1 Tax=marine metagenome TaxID=408172 RepID=A0A381T694_9ZZZZ
MISIYQMVARINLHIHWLIERNHFSGLKYKE